MKTSIMNGINLSKLDFNYMITFRPNQYPKLERMEEQVMFLFQEIPFKHLIYFWEKDSLVRMYHSHILILSDCEEILPNLFKNIVGKNSIYSGKRNTILKTCKSLVNHETGERILKYEDKIEEVNFSEIIGKRGKVYIEPVLDKINSSLYVSKYSDRGLISGYINQCMKKQYIKT